MRSGRLRHVIEIERFTSTVNEYGTPVSVWVKLATLRAQVLQASTDEFIRNGAVDENAIIFRCRALEGITNAERVSYRGNFYNIKELKEIEPRGLEIRAVSNGGNQ
jgi:SPP1 family predicted phage head-tail adaptor